MKALVVDLGGTHANCVVVENRRVFASDAIPRPRNSQFGSRPPELAETYIGSRETWDFSRSEAARFAVGFYGIIDGSHSPVTTTDVKNPDAHGINLEERPHEEFGFSLCLENDARMALPGAIPLLSDSASKRSDVR